jgi:hypothetical protein
LRKRQENAFPRWPVDATVETLFEQLLVLLLKLQGLERIPFVWYWPDNYKHCVVMTHDVETSRGLDYCSRLMDIDEEYGLRSAFQFVPEGRYEVSKETITATRRRGFEVNVHDLSHDGLLFADRKVFLERCKRINHYASEFQADGFRSAILYRNPEWLGALDFQYDMSSPSTARMDAQPGGCCSVLPFYFGSTLELPVTTTQDYSLFHILNDYSIDVWKRQIAEIREHHGLASFIIHPDYVECEKGNRAYQSLLGYLSRFHAAGDTWFALPGEINTWWRNRSRLTITRCRGRWEVDGPSKERARVAYATLQNGQLRYEL